MDYALLLYHGVREGAPTEVTRRPHIEMFASDSSERRRLKTLADQLSAFGSIPFSFHEMESADGQQRGAVIRIALAERPEAPPPAAAP